MAGRRKELTVEWYRGVHGAGTCDIYELTDHVRYRCSLLHKLATGGKLNAGEARLGKFVASDGGHSSGDELSHVLVRRAVAVRGEGDARDRYVESEGELFQQRLHEKIRELGDASKAGLVRTALEEEGVAFEEREKAFSVAFERVPWLVAHRAVVLRGGHALVPLELMERLLRSLFEARLIDELERDEERGSVTDERIQVLMFNAAKWLEGAEDGAVVRHADARLTEANVEKVAGDMFPLCMRNMASALKANHKLMNTARVQYALFLRSAGMNADRAQKYFRDRHDADYDKKYNYTYRHLFGMEGGRKEYHSHDCVRIAQTIPAAGQSHGCPYAYSTPERLRATLLRSGLPQARIAGIVKLAEDHHYGMACGAELTARMAPRCANLDPDLKEAVAFLSECTVQRPDGYYKTASTVVETVEEQSKRDAAKGKGDATQNGVSST